jgi:hypothetical protein
MVLDKNVAAFKLIEPTEIYIKPCSCATTESILSFEYFMVAVAVAACKYVVRCLIPVVLNLGLGSDSYEKDLYIFFVC